MQPDKTDVSVVGARFFLIGFGALAAFCLWGLADSWGADRVGARLFLGLFSFSAVFFGVALALSGPLSVPRSLAGALALALPVAGLISWAGFRFADAGQFLDDPAALAIAAVMVLLATPFLAVFLSDRDKWLDYATLFDTAWTITVRYAAGWLFVGVFWIVVFLSNALLELVDIDIIDVLFDIDWVRFALSGAVLGLGLAVAYELRDFVSPHLLLRLLRLLLPIVLLVVAVFLAALPFRGLSGLFGGFSSAATLMGVAIAAISLISTALDRDDEYGINTLGMKAAARALAITAPILAGLSLWAVGLRVAEYGWTPQRVLAVTVAMVLLVYGVTYAVAALRGRGWRRAIRRSNVGMALMALGVAALWLTPVLNAERISASSQVSRFAEGEISVGQLPLWELAHDWGHAGQAALETLSVIAQEDGATDLAARLDVLAQAESRFEFERSIDAQTALAGLDAWVPQIAVRPEGAIRLTPDMFADLPDFRLLRWQEGCLSTAGTQPGCVWVTGDFLPGAGAQAQAILLYRSGSGVAANHVTVMDGKISDRVRELYDMGNGVWALLPPETIDQALAGEFRIAPSGISALELNGARLVPAN